MLLLLLLLIKLCVYQLFLNISIVALFLISFLCLEGRYEFFGASHTRAGHCHCNNCDDNTTIFSGFSLQYILVCSVNSVWHRGLKIASFSRRYHICCCCRVAKNCRVPKHCMIRLWQKTSLMINLADRTLKR